LDNGLRSTNRRTARQSGWIIVLWASLFIVLSLSVQAGPPIGNSAIGYAAPAQQEDLPTGQVIVFLAPGTDPVAFGLANGMTYVETLRSDKNAHVFSTGSAAIASLATATLATSPVVRAVYENKLTRNVLTGFTPNDPYFHKYTPSGWGGPGEWYLSNEFTAGRDLNVVPAWNRNITGRGVVAAVVDDCLEGTHPDLAPNYRAADSWDFGQSDADPSPVNVADMHGVATGGIVAARGGNGIGVTGVAPYGYLAGLRIDFPTQTTAMFVDADLYHSSGTNTSIKIKNHSYSYNVPFVNNTAESDAIATSTASGTIHVVAAGNERGQASEDSNSLMLQSGPAVIAVAAMGSNGIYSSYSNFGACVFCTAPSSSAGQYQITTTDRTTASYGYNPGSGDSFPDPNYTSIFGGTSAASPMVAGVMTLAKEVRSALNTRMAKHLMVRTCKVVDATDSTAQSAGGWKTNAAGRKFNQNYGFGLVDADALCTEARKYSGVTAMQTEATGTVTVGASIPDGSTTGISRTFSMVQTTPLEEVLATIQLTHPRRSDLSIYLISPSGTSSRLKYPTGADTGADLSWTFCTNAFWGENPAGTWTVKVVDGVAGNTGTWTSFAVTTRMGQLVSDTSGPHVTINQTSGQADPATTSPINFSVVFDEMVDDFTAADVALSGTAGATTAVVIGGGRYYNVAVSGMASGGTVIASISAGKAHDINGNASLASTSTDNTVTFTITGPPQNVSLSPSGGSISTGVLTLSSVYRNPGGFADIKKAYLLINDSLTQTNAALMMYDQSGNKVYLKNDANTSWGTGYAPGTSITLQNSQCYLYVGSTTVSPSGTDLTVNWRIQLKSPFSAKSLNGYMYVQNAVSQSDGWDMMGAYYNVKPQVVSISPSGPLPINTKTTVSCLYRDLNGWADIRKCYALINETLAQSNAILLWYDKSSNKVYLKNDANTSWGTGYAPGTSITLSNSQCEVYVADTTVAHSGNDLTVNWSVKLKTSLTGKSLYSWMYVTDSTGAYDGWTKTGTHFTPTAPTCGTLTPNTGNVTNGIHQVYSAQYSDANGSADVYKCYLQLSVTSSQAGAVLAMYDAKLNKMYLKNDANTAWSTGYAPGAGAILENSQCKLYCSETTITNPNANTVQINWSVNLKPGQVGKLMCERMFVQDNTLLNSAWKVKGYVRVQ